MRRFDNSRRHPIKADLARHRFSVRPIGGAAMPCEDAEECVHALEPPFTIALQVLDQVNSRPYHIFAPCVLFPATILVIVRIEKSILRLSLYRRRLLGREPVVVIEADDFDSLITHFGVISNQMLLGAGESSL
ncbi:hypothetical protein ACMFMG_009744, partial [Clarireedia jacksonii]